MKKSLHKIIFFIAFITFTSCDVLDDISQFSYSLENTVTIEPIATAGNTIEIISDNTPTNTTSTLDSYNTQENLVNQIYLSNCMIQVTNPNDGDFSFLSDINIYIQVSGLPDKRIAWSDTIPNERNLELITTEDDLKEYLFNDNYTLRIIATNDEVTTSTYEVTIHSSFDINAQFIGG